MIKIFNKDMKELKFNITEYQLNILPLDNFSAFGLELDGQYFQTSEHAFQYLKFIDTNPEIAKKIKEAFSPNEARDIAQKNRNLKPENWLEVKYKNMEKVLKAKTEQNPVVKKKLLATKDYIIAEYCTDEDTEWGLDKNNNGENNLGKIWMKIRNNTGNTFFSTNNRGN
ncbi:MAG: NADAR family protein [Bacilli bacterium]|nr:NADAR family protein [Bacilli bacterium]MDD4795396.1 NADAR family protein [Bacilli bacterium]